MYAIYGNIYHQYTPVMLAYIPAPWILWVIKKKVHQPGPRVPTEAPPQAALSSPLRGNRVFKLFNPDRQTDIALESGPWKQVMYLFNPIHLFNMLIFHLMVVYRRLSQLFFLDSWDKRLHGCGEPMASRSATDLHSCCGQRIDVDRQGDARWRQHSLMLCAQICIKICAYVYIYIYTCIW